MSCKEEVERKPEGQTETKKSKPQSAVLVDIGIKNISEMFTDQSGTAYASFRVDGHRETHQVRGNLFELWLRKLFFDQTRRAPGRTAIQDAIETLAARALYEGEQMQVHLRVAEIDGVIYVDLGDQEWNIVRVDQESWTVCSSDVARFWRPDGFESLPMPEHGGTVELLRPLMNLSDDQQWLLFKACLVAPFRTHGGYPVLLVTGGQGSGKSSLTRVFKHFTDPGLAPLLSAPRNEKDLMVSAQGQHVMAFENISSIPNWLSDAMCRISTGAATASRKLYTDATVMLLQAKRLQVINGIGDVINRPDLLERSVTLQMAPIMGPQRQTEYELAINLANAAPKVMGAIFKALSNGLRNIEDVELSEPPRMADFAQWAVACGSALGYTEQEFLDAYAADQEGQHLTAIEASPIGSLLLHFVEAAGSWEGPASELMNALLHHDSRDYPGKYWPQSPGALSGVLERLKPALKGVGVTFERGPRTASSRTVYLSTTKTPIHKWAVVDGAAPKKRSD
jgi:hypothetical protein